MNRFGIDIGANHIRFISPEDGVLFDEPCVVALDKKKRVLAIGYEAKEMKGMMDDTITVIAPLADSTINFEALNLLIEQLCYEFNAFRVFSKTELIVSYPTSFTQQQCEDLKQNLLDFGAYRVYMDEGIWMAAIGANLDLFLPVSSCVLNIGYSDCDIAIFSSGSMQKKKSCMISGKSINVLIGKWLRQNYGLIVSEHMKEKINKTLATTILSDNPKQMHVQGADFKTRQIQVITIDSNQIAQLIQPLVQEWMNWIAEFLNSLSKHEREDVCLRGIVCCGGLMNLPGLARTFQEFLPCPFYVTDDPDKTVCEGIKILLSRME